MSTLTPDDWTTRVSEDGAAYPFVEDENCNITGAGHQDLAEFAEAINRYDAECNGHTIEQHREEYAGELWDEDWIGHDWVTIDEDGERLHRCPADAPGAIAVTTLWDQR